MDRSEIAVSFTLSNEEARRQTAEIQRRLGLTKKAIWAQRAVSAVWLVSGIVEVSTNHWKGMGWAYVVGGFLYGAVALRQKAMLVEVTSGVETTIRFGEAGIVFERPALQSLPWNALQNVVRYRGGLSLFFDRSVLKPPLEQRLAIPNRAFEDDGGALWSLFERMMLGPLRRVTDQLSIDERGAVRRNDKASIANLRASETRGPGQPKVASLPRGSA